MQAPEAQQRGLAEGVRLLQLANEHTYTGTRQQHISAMCACVQTLMGQTTAAGSGARTQMKRDLIAACEMLSQHSHDAGGESRKDLLANTLQDDENAPQQAWAPVKKGAVCFKDLCGLDSVIQSLKECLVLPRKYPVLFERLHINPTRAMLLYGPPGTGKSMLARAVANEIDAAFFETSCAQMISRWVGESEKLMNSLFASARKSAPSVLFLDEVDSIASSRETGKTSSLADQRLTNQLLLEMDATSQSTEGVVFLLAATNLPWQLDPAVLRRFSRRVHIGLPDTEARRQMFLAGLGQCCNFDGNEFDNLAQRTEGYSGSDIKNIVSDAQLVPLQRLLHSTSFGVQMPSSGSGELVDGAPDTLQLFDTTLEAVLEQYSEQDIVIPELRFSEVLCCIEGYPRSVAPELIKRYTAYQTSS